MDPVSHHHTSEQSGQVKCRATADDISFFSGRPRKRVARASTTVNGFRASPRATRPLARACGWTVPRRRPARGSPRAFRVFATVTARRASNPPRPAHGDENAPAQESVRASEKHPAERASSFGDAVSRARTPGGSAETGARLAALKALRSQSRPASGRRAVASPTARDGARVLVPSEDHARASTSNRDAEDASEIASAAERRLAAVAISNEWREFDGHDTRPERSESAATSNASASLSSAATSNASASLSSARPRGAPPLAPKEPTPVIIVTARGPPGAPSSASCSPSPDGGAVLTLARPKTSITRSFRIGARVDSSRAARFVSRGNRRMKDDADDADGIVGTFGGFDAMAAEAATRGIGCALFGFGTSGCSVSAAVRGDDGFGAKMDSGRRTDLDLDVLASNLGACGDAADTLFAAAERVRRDVGDEVQISVQALADVVAAPADCARVRRAKEDARGAPRRPRRRTRRAEARNRRVHFGTRGGRFRVSRRSRPRRGDGLGDVPRRRRVRPDAGDDSRTPDERFLRRGTRRRRRRGRA